MFANRYNPLGLHHGRLTWRDLNSDDIAQGDVGLHRI